MSGGTRFQLKQSTGWFAAGREVRCALELLSDATFKLFVWLCLHAERGRGALSATPAELARALGRKESDMHLALEELERQGVCTLRADGVIEIRDRFWPYQREYDSAASDKSRRYVEEVKRRFHVERAILLGAMRRRRGRPERTRHADQQLALLRRPLRRSPTGDIDSVLELTGTMSPTR